MLPAVYEKAYRTGPPVASPLDPVRLAIVKSKVPCRSTKASIRVGRQAGSVRVAPQGDILQQLAALLQQTTPGANGSLQLQFPRAALCGLLDHGSPGGAETRLAAPWQRALPDFSTQALVERRRRIRPVVVVV